MALALALALVGVAVLTGWLFNSDMQRARAHAAQGSVLIATSCGPIEYQEAGTGTPLLAVHGSGGGHDQGMAFAGALATQGIRVIAMSRFGYLRTPMPADASAAAQADAHVCLLDALGIRRAAIMGGSADEQQQGHRQQCHRVPAQPDPPPHQTQSQSSQPRLAVVLWLLSATVDGAFAPRFQWPLFAIGLIAGSFEEIGWTGFSTPRLLALKRLFIAGLSLGLAWALRHVLVDFRQNFNTLGAAWLLEFEVSHVAALTAYRLLMKWVYANTQRLLLAVLMHASYTGWLFVLYPATSFEQGLVWQTAFAVALWVVTATVVAVARFAHRGPRPATQRPVKAEELRGPR